MQGIPSISSSYLVAPRHHLPIKSQASMSLQYHKVEARVSSLHIQLYYHYVCHLNTKDGTIQKDYDKVPFSIQFFLLHQIQVSHYLGVALHPLSSNSKIKHLANYKIHHDA